MIFRAVILSLLAATASAQSCSVCGDGKRVPEDSKEEIFAFPGQPEVPCGQLEEAGLNEQIPASSCDFLPGLIGICNCEPGEIQPPTAPTPSPVAPSPAPVLPTLAPIAPTGAPVPIGCPDVPTTGCSVCGEGLCVGDPNANFAFPAQPAVSCGQLELAGLEGLVPLEQCPFLPDLLDNCVCGTGNTAAPVPAPVEPTNAPIAPPTSSPVEPTDSPTLAPATPAPIAPIAPTPFPVLIFTPAPVEATAAPGPDEGSKMMGMKDKDSMKDKPESMGMKMGMSRVLVEEGMPVAGVRGAI